MELLEKDYICEGQVNIHYIEIKNQRPALLLIHGQCMCSKDYESVFQELGERYHVYAVDCPGHGKSEKRAEIYTCHRLGELLCEFIQKNIGAPCVVSGHSSGGILAAYIAGKLPEMVSGLLLEDPPFFNVEPEEMQNTFVYKDGFQLYHHYLNQTEEKEFMVYYLKNSYIFGLFGKKFQEKIAEEARQYLHTHPGEELHLEKIKEASLHGYKYIYDFDFLFSESFYTGSWFEGVNQEKILQDIGCPTVYLKAKTKYGPKKVLWAANTKESSDRMMKLMTNAERVVVRSGHDIHYEKPEKFIKALDLLENNRQCSDFI
ncbi:MAG: alpha/beta hydrolase [Anaerostipes sp.]|nr:alpha/beta hydrolase [Anaerostipes sp.]